MGKLDRPAMKATMCEELKVASLPSIHLEADEASDVPVISLFDNQENVETLKAQMKSELKNTPTDVNNSHIWNDEDKDANQDSSHLSKEIVPSLRGVEYEENGMLSANGLCISSHDEVDQIDSVITTSNLDNFSDIPLSNSALSDADSHNMTEDIPVDIASNNNGLSAVLQTIPLVYIPTTKQLISDEALAFPQGSAETKKDNNDNTEVTYGFDGYIPADKNNISDCEASPNNRQKLLNPSSNQRRGSTSDSLVRTDISSLSSVGSDVDFSALPSHASNVDETDELGLGNEEGDFMDVNLHSRNSFQKLKGASLDTEDEKNERLKRKGLTGFLNRNLFSRKQKDSLLLQSAPGWKLFGRVPSKDVSLHKDPIQISLEYHAKQRSSQNTAAKNKRPDLDILSTTALILENRPMNLPSKPPEEEQKHRLEYETMVEGAKRKEQLEARKRKKKVQLQIRHEEKLMASAKVWNTEILPNWQTTHASKKSQELWWKGIPPCVRGRVWKLALGNELNLTHDLYEICASRANDRLRMLNDGDNASISSTSTEPPFCKESSMELIQLDISRTFPQLCIFQKGGPYYDLIHCLLSAYCCYRPDVGYVQGMSFLAAVLLLNMDVADAFVCFSNLLNHPCTVAFFRVDEGLMRSYFQTYEEFFKENLPVLCTHFLRQNLTPDLYITDWMFTLFSKSVPLDVACRVWDMFCRDGEEFLFRVAIGILRMYRDILINLDFIHLAQFLTKLPEDINSDLLFQHINAIKMNIDKKKFAQVLASHREVRET